MTNSHLKTNSDSVGTLQQQHLSVIAYRSLFEFIYCAFVMLLG